MTNEEKIKIINRRIKELNKEIETLQRERERLINDKNIKLEVIGILSKRAVSLFKELGIDNDEKLRKFITGKFKKEDIEDISKFYFNEYFEARTVEGRLHAIYGMGDKSIERILPVLDLKMNSKRDT